MTFRQRASSYSGALGPVALGWNLVHSQVLTGLDKWLTVFPDPRLSGDRPTSEALLQVDPELVLVNAYSG